VLVPSLKMGQCKINEVGSNRILLINSREHLNCSDDFTFGALTQNEWSRTGTPLISEGQNHLVLDVADASAPVRKSQRSIPASKHGCIDKKPELLLSPPPQHRRRLSATAASPPNAIVAAGDEREYRAATAPLTQGCAASACLHPTGSGFDQEEVCPVGLAALSEFPARPVLPHPMVPTCGHTLQAARFTVAMAGALAARRSREPGPCRSPGIDIVCVVCPASDHLPAPTAPPPPGPPDTDSEKPAPFGTAQQPTGPVPVGLWRALLPPFLAACCVVGIAAGLAMLVYCTR
jgi:hypothetical protein